MQKFYFKVDAIKKIDGSLILFWSIVYIYIFNALSIRCEKASKKRLRNNFDF